MVLDRERWALVQKWCPYCGRRITAQDAAHHWLVRRMKGKPELNAWGYNMLLVHNDGCHVPEPPGLGERCARFVFTRLGISPQEIESWRDDLEFKSPPAFPEFYYSVRREVFGY